MNLYEQLLALQVMPHAFEDWKNYRMDLTQYILESGDLSKNLTILGAGRCNDVDLSQLAVHFKEITLMDKDKEAMEKACIRYQLQEKEKVRLKEVDFLGLTPHHYNAYARFLMDEIRKEGLKASIVALADRTICYLQDLFEYCLTHMHHMPVLEAEQLVVVGVHSQLLSMFEWIWAIILQNIGQNEERVRQYIIKMNNVFTAQFNEYLLNSTATRLIIGCEKSRLDVSGSVQGAVQGLMDLKKRQQEGALYLCSEKEIVWPFDPTRHLGYKMQLQTFYKK